MMKVAIFCCLSAFCFCLAISESFPCESIGNKKWDPPIGVEKTCYMNTYTVIKSPGISISSTADEIVGALDLYRNMGIKFLPVNPAEKFVNLVLYDARNCAIETITKDNFKALSKLSKLYLESNKIEKIPNDVFEDLTALEVLWLDYNQIKFINSAALRGLSKLREVEFNENVCIQGRYKSATSVATMIPTLTVKCGFIESLPSNHKDQKQKGSTSNSLIRETKEEIVKSRDKIAKDLANTEAKLKAAKVQIGELQSEGQRHKNENAELLTQVQSLITQLETFMGQGTELKVNLERVKTQIQIEFSRLQASTSQTSTYQELNQCSAGKLALCEHELNQKRANNENFQATVTKLQIAKAQMEGEVKTLNQQMERRTLELESVQAENVKNLVKTDQQITTIASLTTQNEMLSNDFEECKLKKANIDINVTEIKEKINSFYDLLRIKFTKTQ